MNSTYFNPYHQLCFLDAVIASFRQHAGQPAGVIVSPNE